MTSTSVSVVSDSSTLVEVPGVILAVQHLQELESRMRSDEFGFEEEDVKVVDHIIDCIHNLADECKKVHEKLETETINASIVRHRLQFLPALIQKEIAAAIASARKSNAEELERLQSALKRITENIQKVTAKHKELERANSALHPERDRVRQEHEDIIAQLNLRMAEKASKQITLNETRDKVRETNQKIVDLEEGIIQLKEDLIQERADARMEKKRLKKAVYDTTVKTREQKEINIEKRAEVDGLHSRVTDLEGQLMDFRKTIRQMETSRSKLEGVERALTAQYARQVNTNQDLRVKGLEIARQIEDQDAIFAEEKQKLEDIIKELVEDLAYEKKKAESNSVLRLSLQATVKEKLKVRKVDEKKVSEQNKVLQKSKGELAVKAEELAKLRQENMDMEERIIELNETHEAIMSTLAKQIDECKEQLAKERKERMSLQDNRDGDQQKMDNVKIETTKQLNVMTRKINEGKKVHDDLTKEGQSLQKAIKEDEDKIKGMKDEVENLKKQLAQSKKDKIGEVERMEREMSEMVRQEEHKSSHIEERTEPFQQLEVDFEEAEKQYDLTKKDVIALKNKKMGLDESVKRCKRDLEKLIYPRQQLRYTIKTRREDSVKTLKKQNAEVKAVEKEIYDVGTRLRTAMEENQRFKDANSKLRADIATLHKDMASNSNKKTKLDKHFADLREELEYGWSEDRSLERQFCERDEKVVQDLGSLLKTAERREEVISDITLKLQDELAVLADFLDNVAKRRPKDTRSPSRRSKTSPIPEEFTSRLDGPTREVTFLEKQPSMIHATSSTETRMISQAVEEVAEANRTTSGLSRLSPLPPIPGNR